MRSIAIIAVIIAALTVAAAAGAFAAWMMSARRGKGAPNPDAGGGKRSAPAREPSPGTDAERTELIPSGGTAGSARDRSAPEPGHDAPGGPEAGFRYIGELDQPGYIRVDIPVGGEYTIGRFDVVKGYKQSDFEFAGDTLAVSRSHAKVTRTTEGYFITDRNSKAGTTVAGIRLTPGKPAPLRNGDTVSFGTKGTDYRWEETK